MLRVGQRHFYGAEVSKVGSESGKKKSGIEEEREIEIERVRERQKKRKKGVTKKRERTAELLRG